MKTIKYPVIFTAVALGLSTAAWAAGGSASDTRSSQTGSSVSGQTTAQAGQSSGSQRGSGSQMGSGSQGSSSMGTTSGGTGSSSAGSEAQARQLLQAEGYSNITGLEAQSGGMYQAKADKNGQPVNVTVDVTSKKITEQ